MVVYVFFVILWSAGPTHLLLIKLNELYTGNLWQIKKLLILIDGFSN